MANQIMNGWFSEVNEFWEGQALSLKIDGEILYQAKSQFQDILVFKNSTYGTVLVLDKAIQITEKDESSYQEMIAHIPLFSHPNPKKVLVVGGGDGGVLREIAKHPGVEEIHICEIDKMVIDAAKQFLPGIAKGFDDPRVHVHIRDGFEFLCQHENEFDVIITDSSDPDGPASTLFGKEYFEAAKKALTADGIIVTQAESIWLHLELISKMIKFIGQTFDAVSYIITQVPTYPSGTIGFFIASKNGTLPRKPVREISQEVTDQLLYYSGDMHEKSFVLPPFAKKALGI